MKSIFLTYITERMWTQRYAKRTIQNYIYWIHNFIFFTDKKHPSQCHNVEVKNFLTHLTVKLNVAPRTQALALNALVVLYRDIINNPLSLRLNFNKSNTQPKLPVVLIQTEISQLLSCISVKYSLPCKLMYSGGLRLMETVRLGFKT